jgi:hypothetical protein
LAAPGRLVQRQAEPGVAEPVVARPPLIVPDAAVELQPGQMRQGEFLAQLKTAVCQTADEALAGTIYSAVGCPYIERWFAYYSGQDSGHVERALQRFVPETAQVASAQACIPLVTQRVRRGIDGWLTTGEVVGVPEGAADLLPADPGALAGQTAAGGMMSGAAQLLSGVGALLFKRRQDSQEVAADPATTQSQLGSGQPLPGGLRHRMAAAFGADFSQVRVHTDADAGRMAQNLHARAFTIGQDIAFAPGEYQPGSPIGDALLAHELAHIVQQDNAPETANPVGPESQTLEDDADWSAVQAVASLWRGAKGTLANISRHAMPRLRSGLRLQRCAAPAAGGAALYVLLRPNVANAPGPNDKTESISPLQVGGEAAALFLVPGGVYKFGAQAGLGFYSSMALAGASATVSYRGVQDIGQGEFSGFDVYIVDATTGAVIGVVVPGGIRLVGRAGTQSLDWLATQGMQRSDLLITRNLAERAATGPIPQDELAALLRPQGWTGQASGWWLERQGMVVLYRGQATSTTQILSPLAREKGVAASEAMVTRMRAAGLTDDEIAGYVARWHTEPVPGFLAPSGLGGEPLGAVGIPTTRIPGIAAQPDFGAEGVIYVLRVPKGSAIKVPQWGLSAENEWVILNELPKGSIIGTISPAKVPALTVDELGRLIQAK